MKREFDANYDAMILADTDVTSSDAQTQPQQNTTDPNTQEVTDSNAPQDVQETQKSLDNSAYRMNLRIGSLPHTLTKKQKKENEKNGIEPLPYSIAQEVEVDTELSGIDTSCRA